MATINLLTDKHESLVKAELTKLLEGEIIDLSIYELSARTLEHLLEQLGCEINTDHDFNGWECDYWFSFVHKETVYCVSGTAWDGSIYITNQGE